MWRPPMVPNEAYKGEWEPRQIANPEHFQESRPAAVAPIAAVAVEVWTTRCAGLRSHVTGTRRLRFTVAVAIADYVQSCAFSASPCGAMPKLRSPATATCWYKLFFSASCNACARACLHRLVLPLPLIVQRSFALAPLACPLFPSPTHCHRQTHTAAASPSTTSSSATTSTPPSPSRAPRGAHALPLRPPLPLQHWKERQNRQRPLQPPQTPPPQSAAACCPREASPTRE